MKDVISVGASFGDIDNDGLPDLFVSTVKMGNRLFHNQGEGRFRDITQSSGITEIAHSSGAVFFDFNRDGLLDLFVCIVGIYTGPQKSRDGSYVALDDAFLGFLDSKRFEISILYPEPGWIKVSECEQGSSL